MTVADPKINNASPPGKLALWLFLASEVMFFMALIGSYLLLRANQPQLFARHSASLSKLLGGLNTLILLTSSFTMSLSVEASQKQNREKLIRYLFLTLLCGFAFLAIKSIEYTHELHHHTLVARDPTDGRTYVFDGHESSADTDNLSLIGYRKQLLPGVPFDIHLIAQSDVKDPAQEIAEYIIPRSNISQDLPYGPSKNMFFASYFTLTALHSLHLFAAMFPILFLLIQALRGKFFPAHTEYVGLYWQFVDLIWIILFPLLYLI